MADKACMCLTGLGCLHWNNGEELNNRGGQYLSKEHWVGALDGGVMQLCLVEALCIQIQQHEQRLCCRLIHQALQVSRVSQENVQNARSSLELFINT